ncbi:MAG: hypothetical protein ABSE96_17300 [Terracidiphilus sp.]
MVSKKCGMLALWMPLLLVGCKGFWNPIGSSDFTLSNSGTISVSSPGATSGNTSTITVTPSSSFTGTVALTCAVTTSPSNASSPVTCSLSPTSVTLSSSTAQTATLTASTTSTTTTGTYEITVTGTSGSATTTTTACVLVGTVSGNCSSNASTSGNFYVLNAAADQVAGYYVKSGVLTQLFNNLTLPAATPLSIAIAPNGAFLYISTAGGIFDYTISSGQLTLVSSTPISQDQAISMQVSPDNNWLIEIQSGAYYVYAIPINSSNGTLSSSSEKEQFATLPAASVNQVAISPDGTYVFVAMGSGGTEAVPFNTGNAAPFGSVVIHIPTINSAGAALSVAVDPLQSGQTTPRLFYVGETVATSGSNSGGLRAFNFSTLGSGLKEISGSPFASAGLAPYSILPISTGNYVYVVNRQVSGSSTGVIAGFSIASSSSSYSLTALGSTFSVGTNPVALAEDSTGTFVFAVDYGGSPDLKGYTFDSTNAGYLDSAVSAATGTDPVQASAIAAAP